MATREEQALWLANSVGVYLTRDRVVRVRGDDALSWLNGQITNDIRAMPDAQAIYALAATVKGRVISDLWVLKSGDSLYVVLPEASREAALNTFEEHIIMEDVELAPEEGFRVITVQGPRAGALVLDAENVKLHYACARLSAQGLDFVCSEEDTEAVLAALTRKAEKLGGGRVDDDAFADAHVLLAVPRMGVDFGSDNYPQEAGLKTRALSFNKGCYRGQEVIYMLENRGQLARRLVQLEASGSTELKAGATIMDAEGRRVGEVTSVAVTQADPQSTYALGYVKRGAGDVDASLATQSGAVRVRHVVGVTNAPCPIVARDRN